MNETFQSLFGARLRDERKFLRLSQEDAAGLAGISREHWGRCERGQAVLGGEVLAALALAGADVHYILTGERKLSSEKRELLALYDNATLEGKAAAVSALAARPGALQGSSASVKKSLFSVAIGQVVKRK